VSVLIPATKTDAKAKRIRKLLVPADKIGTTELMENDDAKMADGAVIDRNVLFHQIVAMTPINSAMDMLWIANYDAVEIANVKVYAVPAMGLTLDGSVVPAAGPLLAPHDAGTGIWGLRRVGEDRFSGIEGFGFRNEAAWLLYVAETRRDIGIDDDGEDEPTAEAPTATPANVVAISNAGNGR
jgi:hypothetical protein